MHIHACGCMCMCVYIYMKMAPYFIEKFKKKIGDIKMYLFNTLLICFPKLEEANIEKYPCNLGMR